MNKALLLVALVSLGAAPCAFSSGQNTNTASQFYFRANGGVAWVGNLAFSDDTGTGTLKFDPGSRLELAAGYQLTPLLSMELETGFTINGAHTTSQDGAAENSFTMTQVPLLANVTCQIPLASRLHPYLGGGAGAVRTSLENTDWFSNEQNGNDTTFAYQAFAGVRCQIKPNMELGLEYKFMDTAEHQFENLGGTRTQSLTIAFLIRF
jgi:opacity protein-like surface antigen